MHPLNPPPPTYGPDAYVEHIYHKQPSSREQQTPDVRCDTANIVTARQCNGVSNTKSCLHVAKVKPSTIRTTVIGVGSAKEYVKSTRVHSVHNNTACDEDK